MYCLDTNIIIDLWRNDSFVREKLSTLSSEELCIASITLCELYQGAYLSTDSQYDLQLIASLLQSVTFIDFNPEACNLYGQDYAFLQNIGKMTQESDLMIASIAKAHGATVVTRNKKHFANIRGLKVEEW